MLMRLRRIMTKYPWNEEACVIVLWIVILTSCYIATARVGCAPFLLSISCFCMCRWIGVISKRFYKSLLLRVVLPRLLLHWQFFLDEVVVIRLFLSRRLVRSWCLFFLIQRNREHCSSCYFIHTSFGRFLSFESKGRRRWFGVGTKIQDKRQLLDKQYLEISTGCKDRYSITETHLHHTKLFSYRPATGSFTTSSNHIISHTH